MWLMKLRLMHTFGYLRKVAMNKVIMAGVSVTVR
jgi:hypothetical protein